MSPRPTRGAERRRSRNGDSRRTGQYGGPSVVVPVAALALLAALVQEAEEVLAAGQRLPALGEEVLSQDGAIRQLVDGDAPLVEGACDLDLELLVRGLVANDLVVVEPSLS